MSHIPSLMFLVRERAQKALGGIWELYLPRQELLPPGTPGEGFWSKPSSSLCSQGLCNSRSGAGMPECSQDMEPQGLDSPKDLDQEQLAGKGF